MTHPLSGANAGWALKRLVIVVRGMAMAWLAADSRRWPPQMAAADGRRLGGEPHAAHRMRKRAPPPHR